MTPRNATWEKPAMQTPPKLNAEESASYIRNLSKSIAFGSEEKHRLIEAADHIVRLLMRLTVPPTMAAASILRSARYERPDEARRALEMGADEIDKLTRQTEHRDMVNTALTEKLAKLDAENAALAEKLAAKAKSVPFLEPGTVAYVSGGAPRPARRSGPPAPEKFLVWNSERCLPSREQPSLAHANAEAQRLAGSSPGETFMVMAPIGYAKTERTGFQFYAGRERDDYVPF